VACGAAVDPVDKSLIKDFVAAGMTPAILTNTRPGRRATSSFCCTLTRSTLRPLAMTTAFRNPQRHPDVLDEVKWGLDWLVRMQNSDGSLLCVQGLVSASRRLTPEGLATMARRPRPRP